jgi:hypothetical protein
MGGSEMASRTHQVPSGGSWELRLVKEKMTTTIKTVHVRNYELAY